MTPVLLTDRPTTLLVPAPIEDATRREFITGVGAAALAAAFLAACGEGDADGESATPAMRDVVDAYGNTVTIPTNPQRVIAADNIVLPLIMELGVIPIAAGSIGPGGNDGRDFPPPMYELGAGDVTVLSRDEPDYELVVTLQPDLVIGGTFAMEARVSDQGDGYRKIAPVVVVDDSQGLFENLRAVAAVLGREERAEELIADFAQAIAIHADNVELDTVSIARPYGEGEIVLFTVGDFATGHLANGLAIDVIPGVAEADERGTIFTSSERLSDASGQALMAFKNGDQDLASNALYSLLPAVQAGRVYDPGNWLIYVGTWGLGALREQLAAMSEYVASVA